MFSLHNLFTSFPYPTTFKLIRSLKIETLSISLLEYQIGQPQSLDPDTFHTTRRSKDSEFFKMRLGLEKTRSELDKLFFSIHEKHISSFDLVFPSTCGVGILCCHPLATEIKISTVHSLLSRSVWRNFDTDSFCDIFRTPLKALMMAQDRNLIHNAPSRHLWTNVMNGSGVFSSSKRR